MWFIGVEVEQETSATPPKKNPGFAPAVEHMDSCDETPSARKSPAVAGYHLN